MSVSTCFVCDSSLSFSSGAGIDTNLIEAPLVPLRMKRDALIRPLRRPRKRAPQGQVHSHLADSLIKRCARGER